MTYILMQSENDVGVDIVQAVSLDDVEIQNTEVVGIEGFGSSSPSTDPGFSGSGELEIDPTVTPAPVAAGGTYWDQVPGVVAGGLAWFEGLSGDYREVQVRITHYWPPLGGLNCWIFQDGRCVSATASGIPWEMVVGIAAACPWEWRLGSAIVIEGRMWICLDRGSMKCEGGVCQVDLLTESPVDGLYTGLLYGN